MRRALLVLVLALACSPRRELTVTFDTASVDGVTIEVWKGSCTCEQLDVATGCMTGTPAHTDKVATITVRSPNDSRESPDIPDGPLTLRLSAVYEGQPVALCDPCRPNIADQPRVDVEVMVPPCPTP